MHSTSGTWLPEENSGAGGFFSVMFARARQSLFGGADLLERPLPYEHARPPTTVEQGDDDIGWLSLTSDADGHCLYEHDVICMGVTPDDLDVHDPDGGDLSWIGLSPVKLSRQ
jgi:hypothetical protein